MTRDYKRAAQKKRKKKSVPGWLYFVTGLSLGLFATMLVYLQMSSGQKVVVKSQTEAEKSKSAAAMFEKALAQARAQLLAAAKTAKDSVRSAEKSIADDEAVENNTGPRFDFYTILPELEVIIPDSELLGTSKKIIDKSVKVSERGEYVLQTGSFKTNKQAERRKAKLAMLGVTSSIQRVTINDKEVWFRVRVGPTHDFKQLDKIRTQLFKNNITAIALRVKSSSR